MFIRFVIFCVCLFYLLMPDVVFGQATPIFNKYKETFKHPDVHQHLPPVLEAFKDPEKQGFLLPVLIGRFAERPRYIRSFYPQTHDSILALLILDDQFQALFKDAQFHTLVQNPSEVDSLIRWIRNTTPHPREGGASCPVLPEPEPSRATTLAIVSGSPQEAPPGTSLTDRFVVIVLDQHGDPFDQTPVTFKVTKGKGSLSRTRVIPNEAGHASTNLTLGPDAGANWVWVEASVVGISQKQVFTANAIIPDPDPEPSRATTLMIVSGSAQEGPLGEKLEKPFIVEVRDQYDKALPGITVAFQITKTEGMGGKLSSTRVDTDKDGRAQTFLTLGSSLGENSVEASIVGMPQTFTANAIIPADVNRDGRVSIADIVTVSQNLRKPVSEQPQADVNGDGKISLADLASVASYIANARSGAAAAPGHQAVRLDATTVQTWLRLAQVEDDGSLAFREGIANLERLLASLVPKQTALLANYPNPFNPETWIPYRLSEASDVTVTIYSMSGSPVRTLALGHRSAGLYQHKSRAAYWDGRNEFGEPVASGLYFYTLTAGDFTATRKMLIRK